MSGKKMWLCIALAVCFVSVTTIFSWAREIKRSGAYQGRNGSGTFQQNISRSKGQVTRNATWQNEKGGEGTRQSQGNWNKQSGTGSYSASTAYPGGKTTSRNGSVVRNTDGTYTQDGTITGPKGNTATVNRDISKNDDGSRSISAVYTNQNGKTLTVDKDIQKTEEGRKATGAYQTNTGKSGSFESNSVTAGNVTTTNRSLTNQDQRTWKRDIETTKAEGSVTQDITTTNPDGKTDTYTRSVTLDPPQVQ